MSCKILRRRKSGYTIPNFQVKENIWLRKVAPSTQDLSAPCSRAKRMRQGSTGLGQLLGPPICLCNPAPLQFTEPRSGPAARVPEDGYSQQSGLWCGISGVCGGCDGSCDSCSQRQAHSRKSLGRAWFGVLWVGTGAPAGSAGRTFWWEFSQC